MNDTRTLRLSQAMEADVTKALAAYIRQDDEELFACLQSLYHQASALTQALTRGPVVTDDDRYQPQGRERSWATRVPAGPVAQKGCPMPLTPEQRARILDAFLAMDDNAMSETANLPPDWESFFYEGQVTLEGLICLAALMTVMLLDEQT